MYTHPYFSLSINARLGSLKTVLRFVVNQGELSRGTPAAATPTTTMENPLSSWGSDGEKQISGAIIPRGGMAPQPSARPKMGNAGGRGGRPGRLGVSVKDGYGRAEHIEHVV